MRPTTRVLLCLTSVTLSFARPALAEYPPQVIASRSTGPPHSITSDGAGSLYYADGYVHKMNSDLWGLKTWLNPACYAFGVAASPGLVFVMDAEPERGGCANNIFKFSSEGTFLDSWCPTNSSPPHCGARHATVDGNGDLFVNDYKVLRKYDAQGGLLQEWESSLLFGSMDIGPDGYLYVPDLLRGEVFRFDLDLSSFEVFLPNGAGDGSVSTPTGLAFGPDGSLYVTDTGRNRIQKFDGHGRFLTGWERGGLTGAVAVDQEGYLYVGIDSGAILKYDNKPGSPPLPPHPPAILLHAGKVTGRRLACESIPKFPGEIVTRGDVDPSAGKQYFVYLFASPMTLEGEQAGVTGIQMGLQHSAGSGDFDGAFNVFGWVRCSVLDFPQDGWPASGTGNTITWMADVCQQREIVLAGYMYISAYAPSRLSITGYSSLSRDREATMTNCNVSQIVVEPSRLGWVSFGRVEDESGCNPLYQNCVLDTVSDNRVTWGSLKARYGQ